MLSRKWSFVPTCCRDEFSIFSRARDSLKSCCIIFGVTLLATLAIPFVGKRYLDAWLETDISGWLQAGIAVVSFPIIIYELNEIRKAAGLKPRLEVGLANMLDIHQSRVRGAGGLPTQTDVDVGYAHFYIVLRNHGKVPARYIKVLVEHVNPFENSNPAIVEVSEFANDKPTFFSEHNFEFVFKGTNDWIIYPGDLELFGFHISTRIVVTETGPDGEERKRAQPPPPGRVVLKCAVWADGLDGPEQSQLVVNVVDHLDKSSYD